jgi:hypothetical protein
VVVGGEQVSASPAEVAVLDVAGAGESGVRPVVAGVVSLQAKEDRNQKDENYQEGSHGIKFALD